MKSSLTVFFCVYMFSNAFGQLKLTSPNLSCISKTAVNFRNPNELVKLHSSTASFRKFGSKEKIRLNWNNSQRNGLSNNSHALLDDALPSWMDAQMWNSLHRTAANMSYKAGSDALKPPPAEQNFEIHLDAQERYDSYD